jgi:hypothetical protein
LGFPSSYEIFALKYQSHPIAQGAVRAQATDHCHNCGKAVSGHYCANCGQETELHAASAREFLHEFVGHYIALESRLWNTFKLLMLRPGALTREYIEGRRVRYVAPLRLYLTVSVVFFAAVKLSSVPLVKFDEPAAIKPVAGATNAAETLRQASRNPQMPAELRKGLQREADAVERQQRADLARQAKPGVATDSKDLSLTSEGLEGFPTISAKMKKFQAQTNEERVKGLTDAFFGFAPYAIFCLMPVFAFLLKLLYLGSGRRFGEHLLFALHANAFAFVQIGLLFGLGLLALPHTGWLSFALVLWLCIYLPRAMQRVYGGRLSTTLLRWAVLMSVYLFAMVVALLAAVGIGLMV